ncbi:HEPN domain-containing protein [Vibrio parahaemolyticus]|nr:HEPN domain-containing protein [Vibrio parahaemolyticus]
MIARDNYLQRYRAFNTSLSTSAIQAKEPQEFAHNESAKLFRNGLAVVGFTSLEDFIKRRTAEALITLSSHNIPFSVLPDRIQEACTIKAISSLKFQADLRKDKQEKLKFIQKASRQIASSKDHTYELYELAFAHNSSNISKDTIRDILTSFNISQPWQQIDALSARLQIGGRELDNAFKNAAQRRHSAAHTVNADTPQLDLIDYIKDSISIAISFDALITIAVDEIRKHGRNMKQISAQDVNFRFLKLIENDWKEYAESNLERAFRNYGKDYEDGLEEARKRIIAKSEFLIVLEHNKLVKNWISHI